MTHGVVSVAEKGAEMNEVKEPVDAKVYAEKRCGPCPHCGRRESDLMCTWVAGGYPDAGPNEPKSGPGAQWQCKSCRGTWRSKGNPYPKKQKG
jgi:hypothetical protein